MYGAMVLTRYNFGKHSCQVQFRATNVPSNREVWAPSSPLKVAGTDVENRSGEEMEGFTQPSDPFVTSDVLDAQNCGKTQIFYVAERPFRHFGRVGRSKLW